MNLDEYYVNLDKIFSEAAPIYDIKIMSNFINLYIRDIEMEIILKYLKYDSRLLEIGFGTGEECSKVIMAGARVTGLDISEGMVRYAEAKMKRMKLDDRFKAFKMRASDLMLLPDDYDIIYSFNGALNNEPMIEKFFQGVYKKLKDGGYLIVSVRNKFSLGELLTDLLSGEPEKIVERLKGDVMVEVVGQKVRSHYFSWREFKDYAGRNMKLVEKRGLSIIFIPRIYQRVKGRTMMKIVTSLEELLSRIPIFRDLGDETIFVFRKE